MPCHVLDGTAARSRAEVAEMLDGCSLQEKVKKESHGVSDSHN